MASPSLGLPKAVPTESGYRAAMRLYATYRIASNLPLALEASEIEFR